MRAGHPRKVDPVLVDDLVAHDVEDAAARRNQELAQTLRLHLLDDLAGTVAGIDAVVHVDLFTILGQALHIEPEPHSVRIQFGVLQHADEIAQRRDRLAVGERSGRTDLSHRMVERFQPVDQISALGMRHQHVVVAREYDIALRRETTQHDRIFERRDRAVGTGALLVTAAVRHDFIDAGTVARRLVFVGRRFEFGASAYNGQYGARPKDLFYTSHNLMFLLRAPRPGIPLRGRPMTVYSSTRATSKPFRSAHAEAIVFVLSEPLARRSMQMRRRR